MDLKTLSNNLKNVCRVCLILCDKETKVQSVFGEITEEELLEDNLFFIYEILCAITSLQVAKGDNFPSLICDECLKKAYVAYRFKKGYEKSEELIKGCLKSNQTVEEINRNDLKTTSCEIEIEPCITTDIFNLSDVEAENVNIQTIFDNLQTPAEHKPQIKNVTMRNNDKVAQKCIECNYIFQTTFAFHNHICKQGNGERKLCSICGKSISKGYYNRHIYMHSGRRDYICPICNKTYNGSGSLKFHMAKHTGEKPYLCSLCGKRFIQPTTLKYHMRFHNNERRYKCNFCDKRFIMQCHLVTHERVHTGVKPFICEICKKRFTRNVELKMHSFAHTGEKPYKCRFCNKTFVRKTHMTLHEMVHSGNRPHECKICGKGFIQRQPLLLHLKIHKQETHDESKMQDAVS